MAERVDWFRVITDLCTVGGHSLESIGKATGLSKPGVWNIKQGSEPLYKHGQSLLELWGTLDKPIPMQQDLRRRM